MMAHGDIPGVPHCDIPGGIYLSGPIGPLPKGPEKGV